MSTSKPGYELGIWGSNPVSSDTPTSGKVSTGWTVETPALEWQNWWQNRADAFITHINTNGFAEWDDTTSYDVGGICAYQGVPYASLTSTNVDNTPSPGSTQWKSLSAFDDQVYRDGYVLSDALTRSSPGNFMFWQNTLQEEQILKVLLSNDGKTVYWTTGSSTANVLINSMTLSTPWDLTTASNLKQQHQSGFYTITDWFVLPNDSAIWTVTGDTNIRQYSMTTPGDVSTMTAEVNGALGQGQAQVSYYYGLSFNDDGTIMKLYSRAGQGEFDNASIEEYDLPAPYQGFGNTIPDIKEVLLSTNGNVKEKSRGIVISPDGTIIYTVDELGIRKITSGYGDTFSWLLPDIYEGAPGVLVQNNDELWGDGDINGISQDMSSGSKYSIFMCGTSGIMTNLQSAIRRLRTQALSTIA